MPSVRSPAASPTDGRNMSRSTSDRSADEGPADLFVLKTKRKENSGRADHASRRICLRINFCEVLVVLSVASPAVAVVAISLLS